MPHTDIKSDGWIERFLPPFLRPYAYLARLDRPIGIWLLLLPGWWAIVLAAGGLFSLAFRDIQLLALFGIGAVIMRSAGCVMNDLWDRRLDREVGRTKNRPLASGSVTPRQAFAFLFILLVIGLYILIGLPPITILLGFLVVPLVAIYPLMKRLIWWPQLFLGIIFNFGVPMGWSAVNFVPTGPALLLYVAAALWTLGYDTIYAHQDKEDDMRIGIKSTALKFGDKSRQWVKGFYVGAFVLLFAAFITADAGIFSLLLLLPVALHGVWLLLRWDEKDPQSSLAAFKASRDTGLLILLAALL